MPVTALQGVLHAAGVDRQIEPGDRRERPGRRRTINDEIGGRVLLFHDWLRLRGFRIGLHPFPPTGAQ